MKVEKDYFVKYYNQTIKPEVLKFEKQHKEPILRFNIFFIGLVFFIFFSNFLFSKAPGLIFIIMLFIFFVGLPIACASGIGSICFNIYCYGKKMAPFIEHDLFSINIHKENLDNVYVYMKIFNELSNFYKVINYFKRA